MILAGNRPGVAGHAGRGAVDLVEEQGPRSRAAAVVLDQCHSTRLCTGTAGKRDRLAPSARRCRSPATASRTKTDTQTKHRCGPASRKTKRQESSRYVTNNWPWPQASMARYGRRTTDDGANTVPRGVGQSVRLHRWQDHRTTSHELLENYCRHRATSPLHSYRRVLLPDLRSDQSRLFRSNPWREGRSAG
jgi:hypothetical protein